MYVRATAVCKCCSAIVTYQVDFEPYVTYGGFKLPVGSEAGSPAAVRACLLFRSRTPLLIEIKSCISVWVGKEGARQEGKEGGKSEG